LSKLGAKKTSVPFSEVRQAMDSGVIDAADTIKQQDDLSDLLDITQSDLSSHPEFDKMKARLTQLGQAISA
jgi:hypothetical protein